MAKKTRLWTVYDQSAKQASYFPENKISPWQTHHLHPNRFRRETKKIHVQHGPFSETNNNKISNPETMLSGLAPALFLGQCFSLLGVSNVAAMHGKPPVFRWMSPRMWYNIVVSTLLGINMVLSINHLLRRTSINLEKAQTTVFYCSSFVTCCLYMRLAARWSSVYSDFKRMELRLRFYGSSKRMINRMWLLTAVILTLGLVEHALSQLNTFVLLHKTMSGNTSQELFRKYYETHCPHVNRVLPYHPLLSTLMVIIGLTATFIWNFNDLFIMLLSYEISQRFAILNKHLSKTVHKETDARTWRHARETYNAIAELAQTVENSINVHILVSFLNNLYFICMQLLHTVSYGSNNFYKNIYFTCSFGILVTRTVAVSLFAADVYEKSRETKRVLYSVPSNSYCKEVRRFLIQVTNNDIVLTGCNFFDVNRSFLLTVAGTITTYELVLVQFNSGS